MPLGAREVILGARAASALADLEHKSSHEAVSIAKRVRALKTTLLADCLHGEVVRKDQIPKSLREEHGLSNLYVEDLPSFWRLLYTIVRDGGRRYIVVVEIVSHRTYSKWFPGRKR